MAVSLFAPGLKDDSLNLSLRHEVARLIVWHVVTRPVVGAADKAARLMR
jgi:hypothetical protein